MLTQTMRPKTFDEVAGQQLNLKILRALVKTPEQAPRCLVFQGAYGTGKSTCARILARALNCEHPKADGSPCGKCSNCKLDINNAYFYQEYDSAVIGNVDKIRELRDTFQYTVTSGYKVICLDECHLCSRQAQSALLKVIEEVQGRVIFIFATTDIDLLLPTIRSRSLELRFELVSHEDIIKNIRNITEKLDIQLTEDVYKVIAERSRGHMRNAHMLLDKYILIGKEDFLKSALSSREQLIQYIISLVRKDKNGVFKSLTELMRFPLVDVKSDYEALLNDMMKSSLGFDVGDEKVTALVNMLGKNTVKIVKICMSKWIMESFETDVLLQTALLALYQMVGGQ